MENNVIELHPQEPSSGTLPMFNPLKWSIGFLLFGIVVSIIFGAVMPDLFKAAFTK